MWGLAAAFSPDAQPQRAVVATRRQQPQRLMIRLVPVSDANCQYENVRRKIAWSTLGGMTRLEMKMGLRNEQHQDETKPWYLIAVPTLVGSSLKSCRGSVVTGAARRVAIVRDCVRANSRT